MRLLLRPPLRMGEGPLGFQFRLAAENGLGLTALEELGFSFDVEMLRSFGYLDSRGLDTGFGEYACQLEACLAANPQAWNTEVSRYCPLCLEEAGYWRVGWEVLFYDGCPKHGVWLLDRCRECGASPSWRRSELLRCECGSFLCGQKAADCPTSVLSLSRALIHTFLPGDDAGSWPMVDQLNLSQLQRLVRFLGAYGESGKGRKPQKKIGCSHMHVSWTLTSLAAEILNQWPESFFSLLSRSQEGGGGSGRLGDSFGHLYFLLYRGFREPGFDFMRRTFETFIAENWLGSFGRRNRRLFLNLPKEMEWVAANQACGLTGISRRRLQKAVTEGRVAGQERLGRSGRRFLVVRRSDVEAEATRAKLSLDLETAANLLGLTKGRAGELIPLVIPDARKPRIGGGRWSIPCDALDRLLQAVQLLSAVSEVGDDEVSLGAVLQFWTWSTGEVAQLIQAVVEGGSCARGRLAGTSGLPGIVFPRQELCEWYSGRQSKSNPLSVPEVADRLGVKQEVAYFLVRKGFLAAADSTGPRGQVRVTPDALASFHTSYVFGRELATEFGTSSKALADRLSRAGVRPECGPGSDGGRQIVYARGKELDQALALVGRKGRGHWDGNVADMSKKSF